ncbi:hypothetical protein P7K49_016979 [Saguinus oedipus]|uniref:Secreted protein n=1 Tax=Saguinus oedipus TaxID=9490 RepID=A0ABQ9V194_SAGOE|nr:hypothetical protein P7K49_016979 [Saguinus oedipus]
MPPKGLLSAAPALPATWSPCGNTALPPGPPSGTLHADTHVLLIPTCASLTLPRKVKRGSGPARIRVLSPLLFRAPKLGGVAGTPVAQAGRGRETEIRTRSHCPRRLRTPGNL